MSGLAKRGDDDGVMKIYQTMLREGATPSLSTFNILVGAAVRRRHTALAVEHLHDLVRRGLTPDTITYNLLMQLGALKGDIDIVDNVC